jgi:signal recognition particle receptor subunit beta
MRFTIGRKEVTMARTVKKPCEIVVFCNKQQTNARGTHSMLSDYALGPAFSSLLETGIYSDIKIIVNGEEINAHKCVLTARSEKFNVMLLSESTSDMKEHKENVVQIDNKEITSETFKQLLKWLYTGECEVSSNPTEVIPLL